jgi:hypothetical protein
MVNLDIKLCVSVHKALYVIALLLIYILLSLLESFDACEITLPGNPVIMAL